MKVFSFLMITLFAVSAGFVHSMDVQDALAIDVTTLTTSSTVTVTSAPPGERRRVRRRTRRRVHRREERRDAMGFQAVGVPIVVYA